jgi:hypothetical protein
VEKPLKRLWSSAPFPTGLKSGVKEKAMRYRVKSGDAEKKAFAAVETENLHRFMPPAIQAIRWRASAQASFVFIRG